MNRKVLHEQIFYSDLPGAALHGGGCKHSLLRGIGLTPNTRISFMPIRTDWKDHLETYSLLNQCLWRLLCGLSQIFKSNVLMGNNLGTSRKYNTRQSIFIVIKHPTDNPWSETVAFLPSSRNIRHMQPQQKIQHIERFVYHNYTYTNPLAFSMKTVHSTCRNSLRADHSRVHLCQHFVERPIDIGWSTRAAEANSMNQCFLLAKWRKQKKMIIRQQPSQVTVKVLQCWGLHATFTINRYLHVQVWFVISGSLRVDIMLGALFINWCIGIIFPASVR